MLPLDCVERILLHLPPASLCRLLRLSRSWQLQAAAPALWRPHCLALWSEETFETGPPSPVHYSRRFNLFRGRVLCSTALDAGQREKAARAVEAMGGSWDDALTSRTTHLLCGGTHVRPRPLPTPSNTEPK